MDQIDYIFFDCMETLIDVREIPDARTRSAWTLEGSGVEQLWAGSDVFYGHYQQAMSTIESGRKALEEFDLCDRIALICRFNDLTSGSEAYDRAYNRLYANYCENYYARCYVREDVRAGLNSLAGRFYLAVVSNHVIRGGVDEMLSRQGIRGHFQFVVTSIDDTGLRKPHPAIFTLAVAKAGVPAGRVLFVGDDLANDYEGPRAFGMQALLLDRGDERDGAFEKVRDFVELDTRLRHNT